MRRFYFIAALLLTGTSVLGQSRLGVKAGATLTRYAGDQTDEMKSIGGFAGGLSYTLPLTSDNFFSIQPELLYVQKGSEAPEKGNQVTSRLHYLDLPVLARIKAGGLLLEAGPQVGYLLSHSGGYATSAQSVEYRKLDFGYVAGVGYQLGPHISAEVRYNGGIADIFNEVVGGITNPRNSGFQFYLGYLFGQ